MMEVFRANSALFGGNMAFVEEQYERYLEDPQSVDAHWKQYFDSIRQQTKDVAHTPVIAYFEALGKQSRPVVIAASEGGGGTKAAQVQSLVNAYRALGVHQAHVDPLNRFEREKLTELEPATYGFTDADLKAPLKCATDFPIAKNATLNDLVEALKATYCGSIGVEYTYISDTAQKQWLQDRLESIQSKPTFTAEQKKHILERVTAGETLEKYLHTKYVGQKRFSGEGSESVIALLDDILQRSGEKGIRECVLGMAHRGRLNVLVNTLGKQPADLFMEFEGKYPTDLSAGDVKYHNGFSSDIQTPGGPLHLTLAFNPSHLEIVNPVVEGSCRARQLRHNDEDGSKVMPILIHGDAAVAGQGVVMETLNMSQTRYYRTGGTLHVVINNQIGFTTSDPRDTRSTIYCTDVAKMVEAPIFHVNGDDPEAVVLIGQIALDFRQTFKKDVFIDLVCFRRLGHNEQDEPMVTQPLMYRTISKHPGTRKLYADRLTSDGVLSDGEGDKMVADFRALLDKGSHTNKYILQSYIPKFVVDWSQYKNRSWDEPVKTSLSKDEIARFSTVLTTVPENFKLHSRVEKIVADRQSMAAGKASLDWGMAENLAYAGLLNDGFGIRISGQDCGRGTFFHRHAVWHDQNREIWNTGAYIPLQHIKKDTPREFTVIDSVLSEEAVLGFEYGYAITDPNELVIWEGQFGDFANGAQVVIDQFISSGEVKWGRVCGLAMFLPHGYEGQGPEHSSARLERYLQLCAENNMQVVVPSTPAQMFHMIRRQMLRQFRKPLIVMTPKSLLRHKESVSPLDDLINGQFNAVIDDTEGLDKGAVTRVVLCSGKVYFDLLAHSREKAIKDTAIVRVEQLYPFPDNVLKEILAQYPQLKEVVWCQEEPQNQGAWSHMLTYMRQHIQANQVLLYAGRAASASPAVGYASKHATQQKSLVEDAFSPDLAQHQLVWR
ncbi:MAG: 2-oxoglutarate dehydrogenase E1 component [Pseudomonadota bacterium]